MERSTTQGSQVRDCEVIRTRPGQCSCSCRKAPPSSALSSRTASVNESTQRASADNMQSRVVLFKVKSSQVKTTQPSCDAPLITDLDRRAFHACHGGQSVLVSLICCIPIYHCSKAHGKACPEKEHPPPSPSPHYPLELIAGLSISAPISTANSIRLIVSLLLPAPTMCRKRDLLPPGQIITVEHHQWEANVWSFITPGDRGAFLRNSSNGHVLMYVLLTHPVWMIILEVAMKSANIQSSSSRLAPQTKMEYAWLSGISPVAILVGSELW